MLLLRLKFVILKWVSLVRHGMWPRVSGARAEGTRSPRLGPRGGGRGAGDTQFARSALSLPAVPPAQPLSRKPDGSTVGAPHQMFRRGEAGAGAFPGTSHPGAVTGYLGSGSTPECSVQTPVSMDLSTSPSLAHTRTHTLSFIKTTATTSLSRRGVTYSLNEKSLEGAMESRAGRREVTPVTATPCARSLYAKVPDS